MIRPCSRKACNESFRADTFESIPFVKLWVEGVYYLYCSPRCASVDLTEKYRPKEVLS